MNVLRSLILLAVLGPSCFVVVATERLPDRSSATLDDTATALAQRIDEHIDARLQAEHVAKSPAATDEEFVRRAYLDLHGVVPTVEQASSFFADRSRDKRATLIDKLLADPRFAAHLADLWDDYLMPAADDLRSQRQLFRAWLEAAFQTKPWDQIAVELITAAGQRDKDPVVSYLLKGRETLTPAETTDLVSQYFLGVRLNCAQCHDHPFTDWKRSDYWGMAAFFTQFQYTDRRLQKSGKILDDPNVALDKLDESSRLRTLKFPKGDEWSSDGTPHRQAFARWLTARDNPYFARAAVNRIWAQLFGRGLVEPVDDMHEGNEPSHPELLADLSAALVAADYDLRAIYRAVCSSAVYQRTSMPSDGNERDALLLSHMRMKLLTPEQLYESLSVALPPSGPVKGGRRGGDPRDEFVGFFRSEGEADPTAYTRGIPQTLRMMNSDQWWSPRQESAAIRGIVGDAATEEQAVDRLYLRVLSRRPTEQERGVLQEFFRAHPGSRDEAYAELLWSLVNCGEFSTNH
ncbi:MAG: hypothetical protein C0483_12135 [Pirellula sp.]|nr:hypothetical protein [Pirellula sp.]